MVLTNRTRLPGLLSAGVLVAALAAAGGISTLSSSNEAAGDAAAARASEPSAYIPPSPPRGSMVFYVVETDAQAEQIKAAETELKAANFGQNEALRSYAIYKVTTPEEGVEVDLSIGASMVELGEGGTTDAQVIDYRNR
jgi:hypothetical protein